MALNNTNKGYIFGAGGYGNVKFARITDPATGRKHLCVAKKVKPFRSNDKLEIGKLRSMLQKEMDDFCFRAGLH